MKEKPTERPILFSGEMVKAILEGRKTQTRRVVKPQPKVELFPFIGRDDKPDGTFAFVDHPRVISRHLVCPYGVPGDRLWVRETWAYVPSTAYRHSRNVPQTEDPSCDGMCAVYAAGWERVEPTWKPSIHMPRWASRISLEVTEVRAQRIQDISEEDAKAEGASAAVDCIDAAFSHPQAFLILWDSINAKRGHSWEANPWVWAISFKQVGGGLR